MALVPVVHNIKIIAVEGRRVPEPGVRGEEPQTITLLATPLEANKITVAQAVGSLNLTLRGTDNTGKVGETSVIRQSQAFSAGPVIDTESERNEGFVVMGGKRYPVRNGSIVIRD